MFDEIQSISEQIFSLKLMKNASIILILHATGHLSGFWFPHLTFYWKRESNNNLSYTGITRWWRRFHTHRPAFTTTESRWRSSDDHWKITGSHSYEFQEETTKKLHANKVPAIACNYDSNQFNHSLSRNQYKIHESGAYRIMTMSFHYVNKLF